MLYTRNFNVILHSGSDQICSQNSSVITIFFFFFPSYPLLVFREENQQNDMAFVTKISSDETYKHVDVG